MNLLSKINKFINNKKLKNYMITFLIVILFIFLSTSNFIYEEFASNLYKPDKFDKNNNLKNDTQINQKKILEDYVKQTGDLVNTNYNRLIDTKKKDLDCNRTYDQASVVETFVSNSCSNKCNGNLTQLGSYNNNSNTANKLCQAMNLQKCEMESLNKNLL